VIAVVIGGTRSGKSEAAERLAAELPGPVTYVATAVASDTDMAARIAAHRDRRPRSWTTVEPQLDDPAALPEMVAGVQGTALIDSLGPWVAAASGFTVDAPALVDALVGRDGDTVVVSDEVGLSVHPPTEAGRRFADALGEVNRTVTAASDRAWLVVAGRVVELGPTVAGPWM
jgi:adenosyl cobinamide kinase/adenosyl cobinamide phosphate guanylyltransferase